MKGLLGFFYGILGLRALWDCFVIQGTHVLGVFRVPTPQTLQPEERARILSGALEESCLKELPVRLSDAVLQATSNILKRSSHSAPQRLRPPVGRQTQVMTIEQVLGLRKSAGSVLAQTQGSVPCLNVEKKRPLARASASAAGCCSSSPSAV